jgi:WD40 repeat protein
VAFKSMLTGCLGALSLIGCGPATSAVPTPPAPTVTAPSSSGQLVMKEIISEPLSQDTVETIGFSPDGRSVAAGAADGVVAVLPLEPTDVNDVPRFQKLHAAFVCSLAWAPSGGKVLTAATDGSVLIWDAKTLQISQRFHALPLTHPAAVWSPDGQKVALALGRDTIQIFAADGYGPEASFHLPGITQALLWLPGTNTIVGGNDQGEVAFFQPVSSDPLRTYQPQPTRKAVSSLSLSPTAPLLAVGYEDGSIVLLDPATAKIVREFPKGKNVGSVAWSPNGKVLAVSSMDFAVTFYDPDGKQLAKLDIGYDMNGVSWSPDGRYVMSASDDHTFKIWQVSPPQTPRQLDPPPPTYMRR